MAPQLTLEDAKAGIENLLERARGHEVNIACQINRIINAAPENCRDQLVRVAAEQFGVVDSSEEEDIPLLIHPSELPEFIERYGDVVDAMLEGLIRQNPDEETFYKQLWEVVNNSFFPDEKAKGFALLHILADPKIPYFKVDSGLRMSDDEFEERLRSLLPSIAKIRFLLAKKFDQKTQRGSLILRHLDEHSDQVDRSVLVAFLLTYLEDSQTDRLRTRR